MVEPTSGFRRSGTDDCRVKDNPVAPQLRDRTDSYGAEMGHSGPRFETGTTIVGAAATDGVILAADQRMSLGGRFTANKDVQKVERVHPRAAMAVSGSVGPAQAVVRTLRAQADLYEARRGSPMSMRALSRIAAELARGEHMQPLLAGVDEDGNWVFELDGGGGVLDDVYAAGGSGMQVAYGVLERRFDPDFSLDKARTMAIDAVTAAIERDNASGDGITTATITADGVEIEALEAS